MKRLRQTLRLTRLVVHIGNGFFLTLVFAGVLRMPYNRPFYQRLVRWWLCKVGRIIGVRVSLHGEPAGQGVLMVANHISWLDIPLLGGLAGPRFLSKQEVRHWPLIGWLADKSGTLFITRGKAGAAAQAAASIRAALQDMRSVLLFPEGTTTTGENVRTFHARLFAPAFDADVAVQPIALRYPCADGLPNRRVPFVDDQSLGENLLHILGEKQTQVEIHFLPPLPTTGMDRKMLAATCEQQIRQIITAMPRGTG